MDTQKAKELLHKYSMNTCTSEEKAYVETWFLKALDEAKADSLSPDYLKKEKEIYSRLPKAPGLKRQKLWPLATAASIILVVIASLYYTDFKFDKSEQNILAAGDLPAGKNGATLTLSSGKRIILSDAANGELIKESGVSIVKTASGELIYKITGGANGPIQFNTLTTAKGQQYQILLPDGTSAWLNAASSLRFPLTFSGLNERMVVLEGEAFFSVKHNNRQPFRVLTKGQMVEDIGTQFNVNSYEEEQFTKTTLIEGSASVSSQFPGQKVTKIVLNPGQQAVLTSMGQLQVNKVDTIEAIAWKNGVFVFNNESIESIMRKISRWYNVEVRYQGEASTEEFSGAISRSKSIVQVLKMLEYSKSVHFKIEERRITVMP